MATKTQSLTVPARDKAEQDCHCGCAPCDGTCCSFDCIVKPRFFCGQLLTDADLSALLKWARDRFALSRYRHGWGVVCGLSVRCDPQTATSIIVTPGYAVNCCGDDVIVCEEATLDLKGACREYQDPCADLRREVQRNSAADAITPPKPGQQLQPGHTGSLTEGARAVDIYLSYTEQPTDPSTALGRSACKQTPECEYSRTRESYELSWEIGVEGTDPVRARAQAWHEGYEKCLEVLTSFRKRFPQTLPGVEVRRWLVRWIDEHPQYQLCGLREMLCAQQDDYFGVEQNLVTVLFQLVQGCRNAYLQCDCFGCDEDTRVPLARVWVKPTNGTTGDDCRIVAIDTYPPYRRPIQPECWPAPLGSVNVGRFIWHRREEVCTAVRDLGLNVDFANFSLPAKLGELQERLSCNLFIECGQHRTALVYNAGPLGNRVVGFCEGTPPPPPPPPPCPEITMIFKDQISVDDPLQFRVTLNPAVANVTYNWRLSAGTITSGQGTAGITADATGLAGQSVTATVDIGGLDPSCPHTKQGTTRIVDQGPPPCPEITMIHRDQISVDDSLVFKVALNPAVANVSYNWRLSAGTITSGQGTAGITADATGLAGQSVTATVDIGGLDPNCPHTKQGTTRIVDQGPPPPPPCPELTMNFKDTVQVDEPLAFNVTLNPAVANVTYNWRLNAGTITSGQGTARITADATGLAGQSVTATVDVGGLDPNCPHTKQGTTRIAAPPPPPPPCPELTMAFKDIVQVDEPLAFNVTLNPAVANVTFNWSLNAGTITSGQGTARITADATGLAGQSVTATVDVGGLDPNCPHTKQGTTRIAAPPPPPPPCPELTMAFKDTVQVNEPLAFNVTLNPPVANVTFNWSLNAGTITSGQGTAGITADATGLAGQSVTATVDVGGLDPSCTRTKQGTTRITAAPTLCPQLVIKGPENANPGEVITLVLEIIGGIPIGPVIEMWSVSNGTIKSGQGTTIITIDTTGVPDTITAIVEVTGYDQSCPNMASHTTQIGAPRAIKMREFTVSAEQETIGFLDEFALRMEDPHVNGVIIVNGGQTRGAALETLKFAKDHLVNNRGVEAGRIRVGAADPFNLGGQFSTLQLWVVPEGAVLPAAIDTNSKLDNLTELKGIASARVKVLDDAGIRNFADLAAVDPNRLKELIPTSTEEDRAFWIAEARKRQS